MSITGTGFVHGATVMNGGIQCDDVGDIHHGEGNRVYGGRARACGDIQRGRKPWLRLQQLDITVPVKGSGRRRLHAERGERERKRLVRRREPR